MTQGSFKTRVKVLGCSFETVHSLRLQAAGNVYYSQVSHLKIVISEKKKKICLLYKLF